MKKSLPYILFMTIIVTLFSCNDDIVYTVDSNATITFSKDTISFDTVFSTIGSSTKNFQVYNNNDKAVKLNRIYLESGGKSGFRLNVDGQNGTQFTDIDILGKDSIFVFVEVTVNPQDADSPILVRDTLLFNLQNGISQQVILEAYGQDVIIMKDKIISENETFDSARPYLIYNSLRVDHGATLTIAEGAMLCFHSEAELLVYGNIIASGSVEKPIIFRGDRTDKMFTYLPYDRLDGQWGGIHIFPESFGNVLNHVDIHSGNYGILCELTDNYDQKLILTNSEIHNVAGNGLEMTLCNVEVANTQISNTKGNCVDMTGGMASFYHCTLAQFYPWSADRGNALYFCNIKNDTIYPLYSCNFYNSIITGYGNDEIYANRYDGDQIEGTDFNCLFESCLVNTDTVGASQFFKECVIDDKDSPNCHEKQFRLVDTDIYLYNFELDSQSSARGIANPQYSNVYTEDKKGIKRKSKPDAGCYEYNE